MAFVFKRDIQVEIGEGDSAFILKLKKPKVTQLGDIFQQAKDLNFEDGMAVMSSSFVVKLKDMILKSAIGWENVIDENQKPLQFSVEALEDILESDANVFIAAINKVMAAASQSMGAVKDSEKN